MTLPRSYTLQEIDNLRVAVRYRMSLSWFPARGSLNVLPSDGERAGMVEDQVRTYMLAGVTAEHVWDAVSKNNPIEVQPGFIVDDKGVHIDQ